MTKVLFFFMLALSWAGLPDSHAYVRTTTETSAAYFWPTDQVTVELRAGCPQGGHSPWGPCWDDAVKDAAALWNAAGARFTFQTTPPVPSSEPCVRDGFNTIGWLDDTCHEPWGAGVVAVTGTWTDATGRVLESDILLNVRLSWSMYTGSEQPSIDLHRIAVHELGHMVGLDHPDDYGQTVQAVMNSRVGNVERPLADDIAGIRAIYGLAQAATQTKGSLENPGANAAKTGIGIISGWVCEADRVEVEVKGSRFAAAYGTDRGDTRPVCGDADNGFVVLVNWNNFEAGTHRIRLLADGRELVSRSVTVKTFGTDFLQGKTGQWTLEDWPTAGTETVVRWTEALQNIEIVDIRHARQPDPSADSRVQLRKLLGTWRICYGSPDACDEWAFSDVSVWDNGVPFLHGQFLGNSRIEWVRVVMADNSPGYEYGAYYVDVWDDGLGSTCEFVYLNLRSPTEVSGRAYGSELRDDGTCGPIQGQGLPATGTRIRAPQ